MAEVETGQAKAVPPPAPDSVPVPAVTSAPVLIAGSESTDPTVHRLLVLRDMATKNKEPETYDRITAELAELGWK